MAHTDVTLTNDNGILVPNLPSVPVVDGDTISFGIGEGKAFLFFSPGAAAVLSPAPAGPVEIESSTKAAFTFISSLPGAYSVFFEKDAASAPANFPVRESGLLLLEIDSDGGNFGGQNTTTRDAPV